MKKYEKVFREDYERWHRENEAYRERVAADPRRLAFHLMPETGWLNDPNGLCQFHGEYHIYYQYTPFEPTGELKLWGHYSTRDFLTYVRHEPVLFPDQDFDAHGVYSGSALAEGDVLHCFYTGNVKYFDRPDYDYIMTGRGSNTVHVTSRDGENFSEKKVVLTNADYPEDMSGHVRDPKVFKGSDGAYHMVLGARDKESRGLVLFYESADLEHWVYRGRLSTKNPFGYMWECPDVFCLDGQLLLVCCPQGVPRRGLDFWNVHQCTYMKLTADRQTGACSVDEADIRMLDRGFDFYAPQTFLDEQGRRILIGWMGIPDADYGNPTVDAGWQHALTIPRELSFSKGRLIQKPLRELGALRSGCRIYEDLAGLCAESGIVYEAELTFTECLRMEMKLREGVSLRYEGGHGEGGILTLDLGEKGAGRKERPVRLDGLRGLQVFSDTSSLEIFVNGGEEVFTTRVYGQKGGMEVAGACTGRAVVYDLKSFSYAEPDEKTGLGDACRRNGSDGSEKNQKNT